MNNLLYLPSIVLVYGPFLTYEWAIWMQLWAVLDLAMGRFCPSRGPFRFMGRFGIDPRKATQKNAKTKTKTISADSVVHP